MLSVTIKSIEKKITVYSKQYAKNECICVNEIIKLVIVMKIKMIKKIDHIEPTKIDPDLVIF